VVEACYTRAGCVYMVHDVYAGVQQARGHSVRGGIRNAYHGIQAVSYRHMYACVGPRSRKINGFYPLGVGPVGAACSGSPEQAAPVAPASQACVRSIHSFSNGTVSFALSNALLVQIFAIVSISTLHYDSSAIETAA
jgi:hypothetical protein